MKIEDIFDVWQEDSKLNPTDLGKLSLQVPALHSKYIRMLGEEKLVYAKIKSEKDRLYRDLFDYYTARMDEQDREELGWEPLHQKVLKNEADNYINATDEYVKINLRLALQKEKMDALESILKQVNTMQFTIKNAIDWSKLMNGI